MACIDNPQSVMDNIQSLVSRKQLTNNIAQSLAGGRLPLPSDTQRTQLDFMEAHSLRHLLQKVNVHNTECPDCLIRKEDIVKIMKEEGTFIMIYYRR